MGRTKEEVCGALAGGVLALGFLTGRSVPGDSWDEAAQAAAELRQRFIAKFGTTRCRDLLEAFGPQENMDRCQRLSGETAGMLAALIEERGIGG